MTARIIAKLACWSHDLMEKTDLQFYLTWLKDQLKLSVSLYNNNNNLFPQSIENSFIHYKLILNNA